MSRTIMETETGAWFDFAAPDPESIRLHDIARALSLTCRFGGHIPRFYSVAEHALLVRDLVIEHGHPELALPALHHDSHEAYLGDIPTPLKDRLGEPYRKMVADIDLAIATALGLQVKHFHAPAVRAADTLALRIEAAVLKRSRGIDGAWQFRTLPAPREIQPPRDPDEVAADFIGAHVGNWEVVGA